MNLPCFLLGTKAPHKTSRKRRYPRLLILMVMGLHSHIVTVNILWSHINCYPFFLFGQLFELCKISSILQKPTSFFQDYYHAPLSPFFFFFSITTYGDKRRKASSRSSCSAPKVNLRKLLHHLSSSIPSESPTWFLYPYSQTHYKNLIP